MPKPRVVPAGEPTRMPLVLTGGRGSKGTPFLLQVIALRSSASSASRPVMPSGRRRSEEHTSELQSLMRISYAVFCLKKTKTMINQTYVEHLHHKSLRIYH